MVSFALPSAIQAVALAVSFILGVITGGLVFKDRKKIEAAIKTDIEARVKEAEAKIIALEGEAKSRLEALEAKVGK